MSVNRIVIKDPADADLLAPLLWDEIIKQVNRAAVADSAQVTVELDKLDSLREIYSQVLPQTTAAVNGGQASGA